MVLKNLCLIALPLLYAILLAGYVKQFIQPQFKMTRAVRWFSFGVLILHGVFLLAYAGGSERIVGVTMGGMLSILALAMATTYLYVELRIGVPSTGAFVLAFVTLFQILSSLMLDEAREPSEIVLKPIVVVHVLGVAFGYAAFIIAALYGLMYILLFRHIKKGNFGMIFDRLPALEELDDMNLKATAAGLSFMTIAILAGGYWMGQALEDVSVLDPKIVVSFLIWLIFAANVVLKKFFHRGGLLTSYLSLAGFVILMFSMLVVDALFSTFHIFD